MEQPIEGSQETENHTGINEIFDQIEKFEKLFWNVDRLLIEAIHNSMDKMVMNATELSSKKDSLSLEEYNEFLSNYARGEKLFEDCDFYGRFKQDFYFIENHFHVIRNYFRHLDDQYFDEFLDIVSSDEKFFISVDLSDLFCFLALDDQISDERIEKLTRKYHQKKCEVDTTKFTFNLFSDEIGDLFLKAYPDWCSRTFWKTIDDRLKKLNLGWPHDF